MNNILVTGANGYVGSALVKELLAKGHKVFGLSRHRTKRLPLHENFTFVPSNLNDGIELETRILLPATLDTVYHLAWEGSAGPDRLSVEVQMRNVVNTNHVLELGYQLQAKRFVGVGTVTEYEVEYARQLVGDPSLGFIYGAAKKTACEVTRFQASRLNMEHVWLRLGNIFSPGDSLDKFALSSLSKLLKNTPSLDFTEATQPMDFVSLSDAVGGIIAGGEEGGSGKTYYVGSGRPAALRSYLELMRDSYSPATRLNFGGVSFSGVTLPAEVFSIEELQKDTSYTPRDTFQETMQATAQWLKEIDN